MSDTVKLIPDFVTKQAIAQHMHINPAALSQKLRGLQGQRLTEADIEKILRARKLMAAELLKQPTDYQR